MKATLGLVLLTLLVACGRAANRSDTTAVSGGTSGVTGMTGTGAMPGLGGMMTGAIMDSMSAHMRVMDTTSVAGIQAMLPMHQQMAENMITQMSSEMRGMSMTADERWTALVDSARQDLTRMPAMNAQGLKAFMPEHQGRVTRLMQAHRDMMKGMKM